MKLNPRWLIILLILLAEIIFYFYSVNHLSRQKSTWNGPYLSAAANLSYPPQFNVDQKQVIQFSELDDSWLEDTFEFKPAEHTIPYHYNDIGYVYLIWLAKKIFLGIGDQQAILALQAIMHLLICALLLFQSQHVRKWKIAFLVLYAINPFVLRFVLFNHYYFWQAVPSAVLLFLVSQPKGQNISKNVVLLILILFIPWSILARPSILLLAPLLVYLTLKKSGIKFAIFTTIYFSLVFFVFSVSSNKNIWHTAYIGVGAYSNPFNMELSDNEGPKLFKKVTGDDLSFSIGGNVYESKVMEKYKSVTKKQFQNQLLSNPGLYLKNAVVNTFLAFSPGYIGGNINIINYFLSFIGFLVFLLFIKYKQWYYLSGILLLSASYTLYYPPIPAYMFGNYLLIIGGLLVIFFGKENKKTILFLSHNDGSDMRINKEIHTLSQVGQIDFLGIGNDPTKCFIPKASLSKSIIVNESRKSLKGNFKYFYNAIKLLVFNRYHSVHVVNETQLVILWPFLLLQKNVVLDIFDSLFLRKNKPHNQWSFIKRLVYFPADIYLVTDENRFNLLPDFMKPVSRILPNYPMQLTIEEKKQKSEELTIVYYGWLGMKRGTETINHLLNTNTPMKVIMAGWVTDEETEKLIKNQQVEWHGTISQNQAYHIANNADYILCVYAPMNDNNINASPNKVYDAIQLQVPVIINNEISVAKFVKDQELGYILPSYENTNWQEIVKELIARKNQFYFNPTLKAKYSWEKIADVLCKSHGL